MPDLGRGIPQAPERACEEGSHDGEIDGEHCDDGLANAPGIDLCGRGIGPKSQCHADDDRSDDHDAREEEKRHD